MPKRSRDEFYNYFGPNGLYYNTDEIQAFNNEVESELIPGSLFYCFDRQGAEPLVTGDHWIFIGKNEQEQYYIFYSQLSNKFEHWSNQVIYRFPRYFQKVN